MSRICLLLTIHAFNNPLQAVEASAAELDLARKRVHDLEKAHKSKQEAAAKVSGVHASGSLTISHSLLVTYAQPSAIVRHRSSMSSSQSPPRLVPLSEMRRGHLRLRASAKRA